MSKNEKSAPPAGENHETLCARGFNSLLAGDYESARELFGRARELDPEYVFAYLGLAKANLPGAGYIEVLQHLNAWLKPARYVEIGVERGAVIRLFGETAEVVGIDPEPQLEQIPARARIFRQTSDEFFAAHDLAALLGGPFDLAFIDGLHTFEQVLKDFINLERFASPASLILIHDCLPLDRRTSTPERETIFWTGDVWKIIPCLKEERSDLDIFTIPTYPAGLCVISGLQPGETRLAENLAPVTERYRALDYAEIGERQGFFSLVPNRWPEIAQRLRSLRLGPARSEAPAQE
jgi:hypothetical protein